MLNLADLSNCPSIVFVIFGWLWRVLPAKFISMFMFYSKTIFQMLEFTGVLVIAIKQKSEYKFLCTCHIVHSIRNDTKHVCIFFKDVLQYHTF